MKAVGNNQFSKAHLHRRTYLNLLSLLVSHIAFHPAAAVKINGGGSRGHLRGRGYIVHSEADNLSLLIGEAVGRKLVFGMALGAHPLRWNWTAPQDWHLTPCKLRLASRSRHAAGDEKKRTVSLASSLGKSPCQVRYFL